MSTPKQVTVRDLVEEAKKRIVFLVICVVGLSYLMSLTSSSVWVNLPAAASLIVILRYLSLDFDMKRKAAAYNSKSGSTHTQSSQKPPKFPKVVKKSNWRLKVNSPVVEDAIDHFTRHLVSEWVADLWYSRLTPDKEGPEELVQIMNGVLGEISGRMRNINLIDLLTRDLINLICTHLELFRAAQARIESQHPGPLAIEHRDRELRLVLAAENKLHPALFSAEAEHKVLQHLMDGLISFTFKPEDLQCSFFRYTVRELLSCAVVRPVLNLASPRFINERIESVVINTTKANKGATSVQETTHSKEDGSLKISSDHFSKFVDPSVTGVELVQLRNGQSRTAAETLKEDNLKESFCRDPLLSVDTRSSRSWSSLPEHSQTNDEQGIQRHHSGGEWGDILDLVSRRKTQALAPEHFENMWTKGRNYRKKGSENPSIEKVTQGSSGKSLTTDYMKVTAKPKEKGIASKFNPSKASSVKSGYTEHVENSLYLTNQNGRSSVTSYDDDENNHTRLEVVDSGSSTSYTSGDDETSTVTGLDSPVTKVWDGKSNRNQAISHIHHPLENFDKHNLKKTSKGHLRYQRLPRTQSGRKRSKPSRQNMHVLQEVERTSFLSGDGQDILSSPKGQENFEDSSDDYEIENLGRIHSGAAASSSAPSVSESDSRSLVVNSLQRSSAVDSFLKLRCEVLGANIVKSGSRTFAVYSISVTDVNNNSWSIKRRFRHFEELHRRLKEFPEYNLHLPPKHFLSTGLDMPVIQERCTLLDNYLKKLMQLPTVSGSIEVWDFLSVDSQTYIFSNSFSIIETLSVDLVDKPSQKSKKASGFLGSVSESFASQREQLITEKKESAFQTKNNIVADGLRSKAKGTSHSMQERTGIESGKSFDDSGADSETRAQRNTSSPQNLRNATKGSGNDGLEEASDLLLDASSDPSLPTEWLPPNLSIPILDLVDVIFQLQDGGWIRRKAFWVAKQVLQLGMGDAFDDWLIEKIQLLRRGSVVASGIRRVEQILWPDGIFITKHPKRRPQASSSPSQTSSHSQQPRVESSPRTDDEQQQEAIRRAKFVYELMIDNAPTAIVGLVGRREYEQCAKDLYFFLQSSVCLKQLAFDLLELLFLSAFPELDFVFKQMHEEKHIFGEFQSN
ncbi:Phox-associated domain,Sorting nexin [Quillaja saponaria]|uniref:Phox-associated domain,Sorting nexin n=1 Tax=Quillaja saponaria TaxID=32244 RepID=A0AAD7PQ32_QUISA|nr:Phox-associated domain,Sorting nexin [Quillaja saponaria]